MPEQPPEEYLDLDASDVLPELLQGMPNDRGLFITYPPGDEDQLAVYPLREEDLLELQQRDAPFLAHLLCMSNRPGAQDLWMAVENRMFPPGTPDNDNFELRWYRWRGLLWIIITIPTARLEEAEAIFAEHKFRRANGVPTMLGGDEAPSQFPLNGENCWTMENTEHPPEPSPGDQLIQLLHEISEQGQKLEGKGAAIYNEARGVYLGGIPAFWTSFGERAFAFQNPEQAQQVLDRFSVVLPDCKVIDWGE